MKKNQFHEHIAGPDGYVTMRVHFCKRAAAEAVAAAQEANPNAKRAAQRAAAAAFVAALPPLSTAPDVQAFIACVTCGAGLGLITGTDASRYLYAAQVAISNRRDCIAVEL